MRQFRTLPVPTSLNPDGVTVRVCGTLDEPWFVAKDVCEVLGVPWNGETTLASLEPEWVGVLNFHTPMFSHGKHVGFQDQELKVINEPGL